mmetsp:Transcript_4987/g.10250  ORF Transcript_4987/g.10250 Transcript_4987/m.10250 type:complete len:675 (-) Transcript_4987:97-2121(-)
MDFDIATRRLQRDQQTALARSRASRAARTTSAKAKKEAATSRAQAERRLREKKLAGERNKKVADRVVRCVRGVERSYGVANVGDGATGSAASSQSPALGASSTSAALASATAAGNTAASNTSAMEVNIQSIFTQSPISSGWKLSATSIHGEGDKIALPPSILETLTSGSLSSDLDPWGGGNGSRRPLAFRIGILNPNYVGFPSSKKTKSLVDKFREEVIESEASVFGSNIADHMDSENQSMRRQLQSDENMDEASDNDNDDEIDRNTYTQAYLDELSHLYLSYTHATVVEFTQEEGCVGLPEPIAKSLLQPNKHSLVGPEQRQGMEDTSDIPTKLTVDPALNSTSKQSNQEGDERSPDDLDGGIAMDIDTPHHDIESDNTDKTPGHPAYGAFPIPASLIAITPLTSLPAGKSCTLTPTPSSIKNGFYSLQNVKLVLEQSLVRTRATLSKGDVVRTWRRGVCFDLIVSQVCPDGLGVVSCVDTDLSVDIGAPEGDEQSRVNGNEMNSNGINSGGKKEQNERKSNHPMGQGRTLADQSATTWQPIESQKSSRNQPAAPESTSISLPPEPPEGQTQNVCVIQIRGRDASGNSATGRRRFDTTTGTIGDLFTFASNVCGSGAEDLSSFRLVTRFPRRVFQIQSTSRDSESVVAEYEVNITLQNAGIGQGQELFMVETI